MSRAAPARENWRRSDRTVPRRSATPAPVLAFVVASIWIASFAIGFTHALAALALLAFSGAAIGLVRPKLGFLSISVLCTLDALTRNFLFSGGLLRWNTLNFFLLVVAFLFARRLLARKTASFRFALTLVVLLSVELAWSSSLMDGLQQILGALSFFGLLAFCSRIGLDSETWYAAGLVNGVAGAVGGLIYFLQAATLPPVNPNSWSLFPLTSLFVVCLAFPFVSRRPWRQLALGLLGAVDVVWVFLSGSRGSLLVAFCCVVFLLRQIPTPGRRLVVISGFAFAVFLGALIFQERWENALSRLARLASEERTLANKTSGRSELLKSSWKLFLEHPVLGVGTGGFADERLRLGEREDIGEFRKNARMQSHSGWSKILAENGLPGLLLLAGFVFSFAVTSRRSPWSAGRSLGLMVSAAWATALFTSEFQAKGIWFMAAAATVLLETARRVRARRSTGVELHSTRQAVDAAAVRA